MEEYHDETNDFFYLGAQTEWLPAEEFLNINNWDDSIKPSASHYITTSLQLKDGLQLWKI